jgi:outer membrane protein TolC
LLLKIPYKKALAAALVALLLPLAVPTKGICAETSTPPPPPSVEQLIEAMRPGSRLLYLSLEDCLAAALKNNLGIAVERYVPGISDAEVLTQEGAFDPHLYFNATYFDGEIPFPVRTSVATGGLTAIEVEQWFITGGVTGARPSGLVYNLAVVSEHTPFSTVNDLFEANGEQKFDVLLSLTQPLLKNFSSDVNTTGIRVAVKNREASAYQLEQKVFETVFEVEQAYWELSFAYEDLRVRSHSLLLARNLLEENKIRLRVGVLPQLAVLQSEFGVAFREEELIVVRGAVEDARDRLIKVTNLFPDELIWDVQLVPTDEPLTGSPNDFFEQDQIGEALRNRPEIKQALSRYDAAELGSRFARNQLLPSLNLTASIGFTGLDDDFDSSAIPLFLMGLTPDEPDKGISPAFDDLFSGENLQWALGLTFEYPWGNHVARGQYTSANLFVGQIDTSISSLRQIIIQDARSALRGVDTSWKRVLSTRETAKFRLESLVAEKKKYDVGVSTTHNLLKFEEELAAARAGEQRALADYSIAKANLMRANATLLQVRNVKVTIEP